MAETETFQHYEILKNPDGSFCELGRGAMGVTYKAFDTSLRSLVALKVISAAYLNSEVARARFQREARAAAGLRHPNVAGVFHLGEEGGNFFYAMEFIDGETLESFVRRRGALPAALALNLTLQVARALRAAAKVGLVHRDIKPSNLMLSREDEDDADEDLHVKVIDFGLAKLSHADSGTEASVSLTGSAILGTPHYISPEQLDEKPLDARSDIYSLGVTLWYMLTGKPPYNGSLMQVMSKHLTEPPPFEKLKSQPVVVRDLLRHMLEKDPANRPQSPSDLRHEIESALRSLGAPAVPAAASAADSLPSPALDDAASSQPAPLPAARSSKLPSRVIASGKPAQTASVSAGGDPPVHIVTHELPSRRDPVPTPLRPVPSGGGRRPARTAALAGAALLAGLLLTGGAFAYWKTRPARLVALNSPRQALPAATLPIQAAPTPVPAVMPDATPTSAEDQALAEAKHAADAGTPADALAAYTHALDQFPDSVPARAGVNAAISALRSTQELPADIRLPLPDAEQARFAKVRANVERAADGGSDPAMIYLGDHLIQTDSAAAADWYHKAAKHGEPEAMHQLGNLYRRGLGTGTETADYAHWFQEASDGGYPRAKVWLAECYTQGKGGVKQDYDKAFQLLNEVYAAEPNNPAMLEILALAYSKGNGTAADPAKAFALMSQSADLGFAPAWGNLGTYYMNGIGTDKNPEKAAASYKRGSDLKDLVSMFLYARCLDGGVGTARDGPQALALMQQAVEAGFAPAVGFLGTYYMNGVGLPQPDPGKAAALYRQGVERQDPLCQFRYAQCLETGSGVSVDKDLAAKLYAAAAEKGYAPAQEWVMQHGKSAKPKR